MTKQKRLNVVKPQDSKLGLSTIMDRALAQRYGAAYVHLAAFAIDVDRVHRLNPDDPTLPFAWEVLLTELRLARFMDEATSDPAAMLEEMCLGVMELPPPEPNDEGVLGAQLPFAIYVGVAHQHLPDSLAGCFRVWRKPPVDLADELATLAKKPGIKAQLAQHCLRAPVVPPLVEPVRAALASMVDDE